MNGQEQYIADHIFKLEKLGNEVVKVYVKPGSVVRQVNRLPVIPDPKCSGEQYCLKYKAKMRIKDLPVEERVNVQESDEAGNIFYYIEGVAL